MGDDNTVTVWVMMLQSEDGTAKSDTDEIKEEFQRGKDIHDLKTKLFPDYDYRMLSEIQFYTPPSSAGGGNWERKNPRTKLEDGKTYGYFPVAEDKLSLVSYRYGFLVAWTLLALFVLQ